MKISHAAAQRRSEEFRVQAEFFAAPPRRCVRNPFNEPQE
jgi:hypothetical protein